MERYNGVELDPEGAFVYYDDAQRALDAERANRLAMEACVDRDVKAIKDLKAQLATLQAQVQAKDAEIAAWKLELGRMRANHPEKGCYAALPKLRSQVDTLTHANARLRKALQPFAERWEYFERTKHPSGGPWPEHLEYADDEPSAIYLGQLKAAQQALADTEG